MAKILIVDDEIEILNLLELYLRNNQHEVEKFDSPEEALKTDLDTVDLAILDIMMPKINGFDLCRKFREAGYTFPVIMLTAKDEDQDKINGLMIGADDYMIKPFNPLEVIARVNAQLRRANINKVDKVSEDRYYEIHGLELFPASHRCLLYGKEVMLTNLEFSILVLLFENQGKVLSSENIFESVWKERYFDNNNTVMVHMQSIRKKLNDTQKKKKFIQTIWGVGYKIES
ncbi:two-component system response regulator VanR [Breznakia sp. PF5-3]|uniref:response regulator transcription factor n=1 Tax=unclassified Breznakia TaxID=2623764 RepID=UPI002404AFC9|nr:MULTISPECIES: response regulator transcription factor [unclassified Breznakia]MDF9824805.1 two-component system response regulator VanR [Breznakia sp. PM6-1]MDF9835739.1 two-component system response regulator VanR [Breznakia sp. PF5-3]MDF9837825.1 two-component system response regulator VanR [Breznakia sp. PFB2-8]MDF9859804.1 two-component system response regulator VanR [Breznakia sp. PH5-24]